MRQTPDDSPLKSGAERPAHQRAAEPAADRPQYDALRAWLNHAPYCAACGSPEWRFCIVGRAMLKAAGMEP